MRRLAVVTIAPVVGYAVLLRALNFRAVLPLVPQLTAPQPFGAFHDLRWLFGYAQSPWAAVLEVTAAIVLRATFNAVAVGAAWPSESSPPAFTTRLQGSIAATVVAYLVLAPWAALSFVDAVTGLSWFTLTMFPPLLLFAALLALGGLAPGFGARVPPLRTVATTLLTFVALTIGAGLIALTPGWFAVPVAALCGLANALAWQHIARTVAAPRQRRSSRPVLPVTVVGSMLVLVVGGGAIAGFAAISPKLPPPPGSLPPTSGTAQPLLVVDGFDSHYDGGDLEQWPARFTVWQFSYRGFAATGTPAAYATNDTHQSLDSSARLFATQVSALARFTHHSVDVVATSEGTLVVRRYLDEYADPPLQTVVFLSPLVRPGQVSMPPAGHDGFGWLGGAVSRVLLGLVEDEGPNLTVHPDAPFLRDLVDRAPELRGRMLCAVPGVHLVAVLPLATALVVPPGPLGTMPYRVLFGLHFKEIDNATERRIAIRLIDGAQPARGSYRHVLYDALRGAAAGWQTPPVPLSLGWATSAPDVELGERACR